MMYDKIKFANTSQKAGFDRNQNSGIVSSDNSISANQMEESYHYENDQNNVNLH